MAPPRGSAPGTEYAAGLSGTPAPTRFGEGPVRLHCATGEQKANKTGKDEMTSAIRLRRGTILAIGLIGFILPACSSSNAPDPFTTPPPSVCRDSDCPSGEECEGAGCVPVRPTLYPHIQLASVVLRNYVEDTEVEWRAQHADLLVGRTVAWADRIRAANPDARLFEYTLFRYDYYPEDSETWAELHGYDPEDLYLHYREDTTVPGYEAAVLVPGYPAGVVPGWNPDRSPDDPPASATERAQSRAVGMPFGTVDPWRMANITHAGYRRFLIDQMTALADGSLYGAANATGPVDGIMVDIGVYYPVFNDGVVNKTDEFYGVPLDDSHPYALGFVSHYTELIEGLDGRLSRPVDVMPNYGNVLFLASSDPLSQGVLGACDWAWGEVWIMYRGNSSPTRGSARAVSYEYDYGPAITSVIEQTRAGGRRVLGARDLETAPMGSERGRLFTLALYYLVHNPNTFYQYESYNGHNYQVHVAQWQWNPAVMYDVGRPDRVPDGFVDFEGNAGSTEHYEFAAGADPYDPSLTYHVLARKFTNALVLVKMLPVGSVVDDRSSTVHELDHAYYILQADGSVGIDPVFSVSLRNNEGVILVNP